MLRWDMHAIGYGHQLCGDACSTTEGCCNGTCTPLGTVANCASCGDACSTTEGCCNGTCTPLGTIANCASCGDACAAGESCCNGQCCAGLKKCEASGCTCD